LISRGRNFTEVATEAVNDLAEHGFDSQERLDYWLNQLRIAARAALVPEAVLERQLRDTLAQVYRRTVESGRLLRAHPGISEFTIAQIKPKLRAALDRRIVANASLIKLNRTQEIEKTMQRFAGWATSVPAGGSKVVDKVEEKALIRKGVAGLSFRERRLNIDQGHKLIADIDQIVFTDGDAIAAEWHHVKEGGAYQARPEHEARDGEVFAIRDSWAMKQGFMKLGGHQYTDQIERAGELPFCRCRYTAVFTLRDLPPEMITAKGKDALAQARAQIKRMSA
jgi:hypothetical protein